MTRTTETDESTYAAHAASLYSGAIDWADELAIEAALAVNAAYHAQNAALSRMSVALGMSRTTGRHALIRLLHFADEHRLTQFEIASELRVTSSNVTFLVDGLEKEGLVRRQPHPVDRRTVFVSLTPQGEAAAHILVPALAAFMAEMLEGFSDPEKRLLAGLLERFRRNARAYETSASQ